MEWISRKSGLPSEIFDLRKPSGVRVYPEEGLVTFGNLRESSDRRVDPQEGQVTVGNFSSNLVNRKKRDPIEG